MSISYSFHLSNKGNALSTSAKVGGASKHNLRLYKSEDYNRNQIEILQGSADSILDDVKEIYHEEFDAALQRYNEKVRPDRRIDDYLNHVSNIKSDVACEVIIQVGDMDFWQHKTLDERKQMTDVFKSQLDELTQQTLGRAFKDSVSQSLVDDTIRATIKALQERGAIDRYISPMDFVEVRQKVNRTLADKIHDFFDRVKQHLLEKVMKPIVKKRDLDIERE